MSGSEIWHILIASAPPQAGLIDPDSILDFRDVNGEIVAALADAHAFVRNWTERRDSSWPPIRYVGIFPKVGVL